MGNLCFIDNTTRKPQSVEKEKLCVKCKDKFIPSYGGFSRRTPCRIHLYGDNDICKHCNKEKNNGSWNCFHSVH